MALDPIEARTRFYAFVWPLRADVLRTAKILCGNSNDADDLAQETLLKAFAAIESFEPGTDARAWLLTILRRTRIDRLRASAREKTQVSLDAIDFDVAADDGPVGIDAEVVWQNPQAVLNQFSDQQIIDALQALPEEIRLTLLLVDVQQLDHKEAAEILEVPVGTIKSRTHRGRAMLRQKLEPLARQMKLAH